MVCLFGYCRESRILRKVTEVIFPSRKHDSKQYKHPISRRNKVGARTGKLARYKPQLFITVHTHRCPSLPSRLRLVSPPGCLEQEHFDEPEPPLPRERERERGVPRHTSARISSYSSLAKHELNGGFTRGRRDGRSPNFHLDRSRFRKR